MSVVIALLVYFVVSFALGALAGAAMSRRIRAGNPASKVMPELDALEREYKREQLRKLMRGDRS